DAEVPQTRVGPAGGDIAAAAPSFLLGFLIRKWHSRFGSAAWPIRMGPSCAGSFPTPLKWRRDAIRGREQSNTIFSIKM
ncbi:unnamed protein product, partial [Urochloa humidicola]